MLSQGFPSIDKSIEEYAAQLNANIFRSIATRGLIPLSGINKQCLVNFVLGSSALVQDNICVNYLELKGCSATEIAAAVKIALWEEYTGAFGISLERAWPVSSPTQEQIVTQQVNDRLNNNIMFVLKPPALDCPPAAIRASSRMQRVCYAKKHGASNDGLSQVRSSFLTDNKGETSDKLTEVKTPYNFKPSDILAILVPEHLMPLANREFSGQFTLIPVPTTKSPVSLNQLPEILTILHGEKLSGNLMCFIPDYEEILRTQIAPKFQNFSLHTVRLITPADISTRFITDLEKARKNLEVTQAKVVTKFADKSGWVLIHASHLLKPSDRAIRAMSQAVPQDQLLPKRVNTVLRDELIQAKGSFMMLNYYVPLDKKEQQSLLALGIKGICLGKYIMFSVPEKYRDLIQKDIKSVLRTGEQVLAAAATKIQKVYRGHRVRLLVHQFKESLSKVDKARQQLSAAESEMLAIRNKLM